MKANKSIFARKTTISGFNTKKNYSSFWMDEDSDIYSRFGGLGTEVKSSSDLFKVIKLNNYRRAVTNFVKIVTNMDIPVTWFNGGSYTDSKTINLTSDIKDNNFDVTVGLALHEASHIKLTDFQILVDLFDGKIQSVRDLETKHQRMCKDLVKEMLNWIEDRRIDHYIFSTSPGYKAYYHKLYDYYWNDKAVDRGFNSKTYCDPSQVSSYEFHIINMLNPLFNAKALPGLEEIAKLIDVRNISRLKSTSEVLEVAVAVVDVIFTNTQAAKDESQDGGKGEKGEGEESQEGEGGEGSEGGEGNESEGGESELRELTDKEAQQVQKALDNMRNFLDGVTDKKRTTKGLQKQLDNTATESMQIQSVGGTEGVNATSSILMDGITSALSDLFAKEDLVKELEDKRTATKDSKTRSELYTQLQEVRRELGDHPMRRYFNEVSWRNETQSVAVRKGLEMGALLGKKLQLHNESRERMDNRLRSGKIDNRRLAHAGYGIDSIFHQITIDKYKKANLHISLDGSGSMHGSNWDSAAQMTAAIAKAITYTQNINLQVSIRGTSGTGGIEIPLVINIYDSRKNGLNHLARALSEYTCASSTPEGLCFEAMYKQNQLVTGTNDLDSYFLNISDGMPGMNGYGGYEAVHHTAKWVNKMTNDHKIKLMSFFLSDNYTDNMERLLSDFNNSWGGKAFRQMYGRDAAVVNPQSVMDIARELNKKFMTK